MLPDFNIIFTFLTKIVVEEIPLEKDSIATCTIRIVGDLMCHSTQYNYAHVEDDSFDFTGVYSEVKDYLRDADIYYRKPGNCNCR